MVEVAPDALEVADAVAVRVGEGAGIDLVDDGGLPPRLVGHRGDRTAGCSERQRTARAVARLSHRQDRAVDSRPSKDQPGNAGS